MKNMRQRPRVEINHLVSYTCHDGNDEYSSTDSGLLLNISTNGALIESRQPFTGKFLVLANNNIPNPRMVKGEIVYDEMVIAPEDDVQGMYRAGIKFTDLHDNAKEFVVSIVQPEISNSFNNSDKPSSETELEFDFDTINQILNDDTPTEDLILIEELLEDEDKIDYDVLEDISKVLKEATISGPEVRGITEKGKKKTNDKAKVETPEFPDTSKFLPYFNAICLSVVCLIFLTVVILNFSNSSSKSFLVLPGKKTVMSNLNNENDEQLIKEITNKDSRKSKAISLINKSVKSRFIQKEDTGYNFVINGLINKSVDIKPEDIKVTAKIFSKNDSLLGKVSIIVTNNRPEKNKRNDKNHQKVIPFLITFSNPPKDISRFSVDLDI